MGCNEKLGRWLGLGLTLATSLAWTWFPTASLASDATITAKGRFVYREGYKNIPIRNAKVTLYDYDFAQLATCMLPGTPLDLCRTEMGHGTTDDNGDFEFEGTAGDLLFDLPDPYVQIEATSDAVMVQSAPNINYCLRSGKDDPGNGWVAGRKENAENGEVVDFETISPANGTGCSYDFQSVNGEDAPWQHFNLINMAYDFMKPRTEATNGSAPMRVVVLFPDPLADLEVSFYSINLGFVYGAVHLASDDAWEVKTLLHEYGHHLMYHYYFAVVEMPWPPDYCNGNNDGPPPDPPCGHDLWDEEKDPVAWLEAWPWFISEVLAENWASDPQNNFSFTPRFETHAPLGVGAFERMEGINAAVLWDLYDSVADNHSRPPGELSDDSVDRLSLTFDELWEAVYSYDPEPSNPLHDRPLNLQEYWAALRSLPSNSTGSDITNRVSEVYHENHVTAPAVDLRVTAVSELPEWLYWGETHTVSETTTAFAPTFPGISTGSPSSTGLYLHDSATLPFITTPTGASAVLGERPVPTLLASALSPAESTQDTVIVVPAVSPGTYWLHVCADVNEEVFESDPDNNCQVSAQMFVDAPDRDGDGYKSDVDCNDFDASVNPGARERCNQRDDDCDLLIDEGATTIYYPDGDGDGYGDGSQPSLPLCSPPVGHVSNKSDCDDADASVNPGASEVCNESDDNCNGAVDEGVTDSFYADADGDGHGDPAASIDACTAPSGYVDAASDCNDADGSIHPGASEICDGADNDCDIQIDEGFDVDGDGFTTCAGDCDDSDGAVNPAATEVCNGHDDDCDGAADEGFDADGDATPDCFDCCPGVSNPDQSDVDADGAGDVCDPCAADATDTCNTERSAADSMGANGGTLVTPDGSVTIEVPPGALGAEVSLSVTEVGTSFELVTDLGIGAALFGVSVQPDGLQFAAPVTLIFSWPDVDDDGVVDGTVAPEAELRIAKDGVILSERCADDPRCDTAANTLAVEVTGLSEIDLLVMNGPPVIETLTAPLDPRPVGSAIEVGATFSDPGFLDVHTAVWDWDDGTSTPGVVTEVAGAGSVAGSHAYAEPGIYAVKLTLWDQHGVSAAELFEFVVVYDASAGFVTGGGWIDSPAGAYAPDPSLAGKATFGFVSRYRKGASTPTGETEFQFKVADLAFHSDAYEWLVIAGARAQYKGTGTINGAGSYGFMLTAIDGAVPGGGGSDRFRIKIWDKDADGQIVYDNAMGASDDAEVSTELQGGSIVIHKVK